jgi:hypothetical protein
LKKEGLEKLPSPLSDRSLRRTRSRLLRLLAAGLALTGLRASAQESAKGQREIDLLLSKLPGFRAHQLAITNPSFPADHPSPDGKWLAYTEEGPPPGAPGEGTYPRYLALWDRDGRFLKNATKDWFYYVRDFVWSQTDGALYVKVIPSLERNQKIEPIWKLDLRLHKPVRPRLPWLPQNIDQDLPVMSPSGDSYLLDDPLTGSIWRILLPSGKRRRLTEGYAPRWSPDGQRILFCREPRNGGCDFWIMRKDGRGLRRILGKSEVEEERVRRGWPKPCGDVDLKTVGFLTRRPLILFYQAYEDCNGALRGGVWFADYEHGRRELTPITLLHLCGMSQDGEHLFLYRQRISSGNHPAYFRLDYEPTERPRIRQK